MLRKTLYTAIQIMSSRNNYNSRLETLARAPPRTKVALIRSLLPGIELALNSGQRLKDIWKELNDEGLGMSYHGFHKTLQRARRNRKPTATGGSEKQAKSLQTQGLQETKVETGGGKDPFANLSRLAENRPVFHWRGTRNVRPAVQGTEESNDKSKR
jgi:hypothetical protein